MSHEQITAGYPANYLLNGFGLMTVYQYNGTKKKTFKVAALQMVSGTDVDTNLRQADELMARAAGQGAELVCLPEMFCFLGQDDAAKVQIAEPFGKGRVQDYLQQAAQKYHMYVVGGSIPLVSPEPERVFNTSLVYSPEGECIARYDKIHLFSIDQGRVQFDEAQTVYPGNAEPVVFDSPFGPIGLSICYDLRFPELYRQMGAVNLLLAPSAFTFKTGQAHWELLLKARAVENQTYVLGPAQGGLHQNGRRTWGHSMCVDAWGQVMDVLPNEAGLVCCELSMDHLSRVRERLPALSHRVL